MSTIVRWFADRHHNRGAKLHKKKDPSIKINLEIVRILLETALTNQEKIGWHYALRGYLSTSWVDSEHIVNQQPHDGI
jgi:hypothetical protein